MLALANIAVSRAEKSSQDQLSSQIGACSACLSLTLVAIPACTTLFDEQFTPLRVNKIMFEVYVQGSFRYAHLQYFCICYLRSQIKTGLLSQI